MRGYNMKKTCDMHIHTNYSDGLLSPEELIYHAKSIGLEKLSITDHDSVDFYLDKTTKKALADTGINCITGCEFVCACDDVPIEILGYGIDVKKAKKYLDKHGITQNTLERYRSEMIPKVFLKHGIELDYDPSQIDFSKKNPRVLQHIYSIILNNPDAVNLMCEENPDLLGGIDAFLRLGLNNPKSKICIEPHKVYPQFQTITDLIKTLGGLSFLAHPYQYKNNMTKVLNSVKDYVDGIECYHFTSRSSHKSSYLKHFCEKHNLMISGGSDFHTLDASSEKSLLNALDVPEQYFDNIAETLKTKTNK